MLSRASALSSHELHGAAYKLGQALGVEPLLSCEQALPTVL